MRDKIITTCRSHSRRACCVLRRGLATIAALASMSFRFLQQSIFVVGMLVSLGAVANSGGISGYHGYPSNADSTTCRNCHTGDGFPADDVSITLTAPAQVPHNMASTGFQLQGAGGNARGFNLAIYRGISKQTTLFTSLSLGVTESSNELTHSSRQTRNSWTYGWTAPPTLGTYKIYACLNPVSNPDPSDSSANDGAAKCTTKTFTVINNPPAALNNTTAITVSEDATVYSGTVNMLSNDNQTESDAFAWLSNSVGSIQGDLNRTTGGTYRYRPGGAFESLDTGDFATETFTYTIRETSYTGATQCVGSSPCTDTATVTIRVNGANDAPIGLADTVSVAIAGTATTVVEAGASSVLANDTDADAGEAVKQAELVPGMGPSFHSAFTLNANGNFSYTHDGSGNLGDSFVYRVFDGTSYSANTTVTITVSNTAPIAVADGAIVDEGGSVNFTVLGNDTDTETGFATEVLPGSITNQVGGVATIQGNQSITFVHDGTESPASFRYRASDGFLSSASDALVTLTVNPINDDPDIASIVAQSATEGVTLTVTPTVDDPDDPNNGSGALTWSITGPADYVALGMSISSTGVFSWTPTLGTAPTPGMFNDMETVDIRVQDDTVGSVPDTESFNITINPPDDDGDMVADYNDFCPSPAPNSVDSTNADFDGDGTRGSDADPNDSIGGDVCDIDDDNDGMPDSFETASSLNPFDDTDANLDSDGDGVTNLQEFLDGTNPNLGNLNIDATGYLTPYELIPPPPASIHSEATAVTPVLTAPAVSSSAYGPYRPGNNTITWMPSNGSDDDLATNDPGNLVSDPPTQPFFIRPLVSFDVNQQVEENSAAGVTVTVRLNGDSPLWSIDPMRDKPATVNYTISGTAEYPADHNAVAGVLVFNYGEYEKDISPVINVFTDGVVDPNETIVFELVSATNAVIGSNKTHTVTILEDNITPRASLQFTQGTVVSSAYVGSPITIDARPSDANSAQMLSCDWSGTDNALLPPGIVADCITTPNWTVAGSVAAGNYLIDVVVADNGSPAKSIRVSRILHIDEVAAVTLGVADDSDMDGDFDAVEGFADDDGDGIPAYLDAIDASNLIPDQTVDMTKVLLLETEPGLTLRRGTTTQAANLFGALVSDLDIARFGSVSGDAPINSADELEHVGGIYDFEIDGLIPGTSVRIVIPLQSAIPQDARYRKYNPATGWSDFVVDTNNQVESATGELGACPEPGSSAYLSGLNYLDNCIQLTIQDGGPNDTDNLANGVINDPATVGVELTEPAGFDEVEDGSGGGRMSPLLLTMLLVFGGLAFWRRRRGFSID
jgi:VCBS repeat-containing protein